LHYREDRGYLLDWIPDFRKDCAMLAHAECFGGEKRHYCRVVLERPLCIRAHLDMTNRYRLHH
jgi:hypothetical protein